MKTLVVSEKKEFLIKFINREDFSLFLEELIVNVIEPFFQKISIKHKKKYENESWLFKQKKKLAKNLIKFLSKNDEELIPIYTKLRETIDKMTHKDNRINIYEYYLQLDELLLAFLLEKFTLTEYERVNYKNKIINGYEFFSVNNAIDIELLSPNVLECLSVEEEVIEETLTSENFFNEFDIEVENIEDLEEVENDFFKFLYSAVEFNNSFTEHAQRIISRYAQFLFALSEEFKVIYNSIVSLSQAIENINRENIDKNFLMVKRYFEATFEDLIKWRNAVFIEKSCNDIHYLDKSFSSSVEQLIVLLSDSEEEKVIDNSAVEDELEFF